MVAAAMIGIRRIGELLELSANQRAMNNTGKPSPERSIKRVTPSRVPASPDELFRQTVLMELLAASRPPLARWTPAARRQRRFLQIKPALVRICLDRGATT